MSVRNVQKFGDKDEEIWLIIYGWNLFSSIGFWSSSLEKLESGSEYIG
ncbi:hypothetical protein [Peribacillus butanolivorans]